MIFYYNLIWPEYIYEIITIHYSRVGCDFYGTRGSNYHITVILTREGGANVLVLAWCSLSVAVCLLYVAAFASHTVLARAAREKERGRSGESIDSSSFSLPICPYNHQNPIFSNPLIGMEKYVSILIS